MNLSEKTLEWLISTPVGEWLVSIGFNMVKHEVFFLLPACMFLVFRLIGGKNITSSWVIPLFYAYVVVGL